MKEGIGSAGISANIRRMLLGLDNLRDFMSWIMILAFAALPQKSQTLEFPTDFAECKKTTKKYFQGFEKAKTAKLNSRRSPQIHKTVLSRVREMWNIWKLGNLACQVVPFKLYVTLFDKVNISCRYLYFFWDLTVIFLRSSWFYFPKNYIYSFLFYFFTCISFTKFMV